ncbi:microtubule-actin cross-linking factor 1, isoform 4 [Caerostris extrusa]|uniref:Microtubule-actin cross-linking factor 1, isoform 4 n=1 Tax=Caerostris extrusa TaxID=172846 RepID=A0AAV4N7Y2_CAEEX|nr:microtubule-actin cross-linking factor 1, isoform 4 [Caerostris extrusa]
MFQVLGPIASEPRMVTSQVQQVQVMRDEFTSQQYLIDRLNELSKTIIQYLNKIGLSTVKITEQMSMIQHQWNDMSGRLIEREKNLETASGIVKDFHKSLSELQGKVQLVSDKFDSLEKEEIDEELDKQRPLITDVFSVCEQLCDILSDSASKTEIKYKVTQLEKFYSTLKKKIACEEISSWLKTTETSFSHFGPISADMSKLLKETEEFEALKSELSVHYQEYRNIQQVGEEILSTSEIDKEAIKKQLTTLKKKWKDLNNDVSSKVQSLEDLFQTVLDFEENLRDLQHSIQRLEDKMCSHDALGDVSCDPVLLDRLKILLEEAVAMKMKSISNQIFYRPRKKKSGIRKMYEEISKHDHIPETKNYFEQINTLSRQIARLEEHVNEKEITIATMITRIESFHSMYSDTEKITKSLLKKEETFDATVGDVETIRRNQQKFKEFHSSEVIPLSKQIVEVNKIGQGLIQSATGGVDTTDLEQKLEVLNNSWNNLQESVS